MNKAIMKVVTDDLLRAVGESAIGMIAVAVGAEKNPHAIMSESSKKNLMYIGMMRWHGLIPDEWIMASLARQHGFAVRDGHTDAAGLQNFQKKVMSILRAAEKSYEHMLTEHYKVDLKTQPRIGETVGQETHELLEKIGATKPSNN